MNAEETIKEFKSNCEKYSGGKNDMKGVITGLMNKACGGEANRYLVLKALTGKTSSKLLTDAEWYGLLLLIQPEKPEGGKWQSAIGDYELSLICGQILGFSAKQDGQLEIPF